MRPDDRKALCDVIAAAAEFEKTAVLIHLARGAHAWNAEAAAQGAGYAEDYAALKKRRSKLLKRMRGEDDAEADAPAPETRPRGRKR